MKNASDLFGGGRSEAAFAPPPKSLFISLPQVCLVSISFPAAFALSSSSSAAAALISNWSKHTPEGAPSHQYGSISFHLASLSAPCLIGATFRSCLEKHIADVFPPIAVADIYISVQPSATLQKVGMCRWTGGGVVFRHPEKSRQRDSESALTPQSEAVGWNLPITEFIIHSPHFQRSMSY